MVKKQSLIEISESLFSHCQLENQSELLPLRKLIADFNALKTVRGSQSFEKTARQALKLIADINQLTSWENEAQALLLGEPPIERLLALLGKHPAADWQKRAERAANEPMGILRRQPQSFQVRVRVLGIVRDAITDSQQLRTHKLADLKELFESMQKSFPVLAKAAEGAEAAEREQRAKEAARLQAIAEAAAEAEQEKQRARDLWLEAWQEIACSGQEPNQLEALAYLAGSKVNVAKSTSTLISADEVLGLAAKQVSNIVLLCNRSLHIQEAKHLAALTASGLSASLVHVGDIPAATTQWIPSAIKITKVDQTAVDQAAEITRKHGCGRQLAFALGKASSRLQEPKIIGPSDLDSELPAGPPLLVMSTNDLTDSEAKAVSTLHAVGREIGVLIPNPPVGEAATWLKASAFVEVCPGLQDGVRPASTESRLIAKWLQPLLLWLEAAAADGDYWCKLGARLIVRTDAERDITIMAGGHVSVYTSRDDDVFCKTLKTEGWQWNQASGGLQKKFSDKAGYLRLQDLAAFLERATTDCTVLQVLLPWSDDPGVIFNGSDWDYMAERIENLESKLGDAELRTVTTILNMPVDVLELPVPPGWPVPELVDWSEAWPPASGVAALIAARKYAKQNRFLFELQFDSDYWPDTHTDGVWIDMDVSWNTGMTQNLHLGIFDLCFRRNYRYGMFSEKEDRRRDERFSKHIEEIRRIFTEHGLLPAPLKVGNCLGVTDFDTINRYLASSAGPFSKATTEYERNHCSSRSPHLYCFHIGSNSHCVLHATCP